MKIALFGFRAIGQGSGGAEKAAEELSIRLAKRGHDVTGFCRSRYNEANLSSYQGVRLVNRSAIYTKHLEAISHSTLSALGTLRHFDVVHVHATGPSMVSFLPRLAGRKVVVTVHGLDWRREKWGPAARAILKAGAWTAVHFPHRTIVVSRQLQQYYRDRYGAETDYIPNGVPPVQKRPIERLRRFGINGKDYVLYLGRLVPEKGCHFLIEAFKQLDTDHKLLIVGDQSHSGDYHARIQALAKGDERVVFTGPLYGEDKDEAFSNAICFVLPSTMEGLPIVLLEALGYGCPVLCSDIPENLEIVRPEKADETYASVFHNGSSDDLCLKLASLLDAPASAFSTAERALTSIVPYYSWDRIAEQTERLYLELVKTSSP